jgi:hypothetical protein
MDEIKMLVEMAGKRLLAGDVFMSMHYINLAQQVQPLSASFSYDEEVTKCLACCGIRCVESFSTFPLDPQTTRQMRSVLWGRLPF